MPGGASESDFSSLLFTVLFMSDFRGSHLCRVTSFLPVEFMFYVSIPHNTVLYTFPPGHLGVSWAVGCCPAAPSKHVSDLIFCVSALIPVCVRDSWNPDAPTRRACVSRTP